MTVHLKSLRARRNRLANASQADDAERLALEFDAGEGFALPTALG